jgi:hypothetical protein
VRRFVGLEGLVVRAAHCNIGHCINWSG